MDTLFCLFGAIAVLSGAIYLLIIHDVAKYKAEEIYRVIDDAVTKATDLGYLMDICACEAKWEEHHKLADKFDLLMGAIKGLMARHKYVTEFPIQSHFKYKMEECPCYKLCKNAK